MIWLVSVPGVEPGPGAYETPARPMCYTEMESVNPTYSVRAVPRPEADLGVPLRLLLAVSG